ncbi:MAG: DUF3526 domain-containing protein [Acidobacteriota bacterium]
MSKIWTIVRNEWTLMRRSAATWWAGGLFLAAVAYAIVGGLAWQATRAAETASTELQARSGLAEQRAAAAETPGRVGGASTYAALPPGPLAAFSVGLTDLLPERAEISIWRRPDTLFGRYQLESPLSLLVGRFDLGFVVLYLLPLFVLVLSYDMLAREREGGRLALILTQPISLSRLLAAKVVARLIPLTLLLTALVALTALLAGTPSTAWLRLAGWGVIAWLYSVFWLAVCALVAAVARRPETCATLLAALWLVVVLVMPGLLDVVARATHPVPSRLEYVTAMRQASSAASRESAELLSRYYHEHPELAANGEQGGFMPAYYAAERDVERRLAPLIDDFEQRLGQQQGLVERWGYASPAVLAQEALIETAGASLWRHRAYASQARTFLAEWHAELAPRIFLGQSLEAADYDRLPQFTFAEPAVSRRRFAGSVLGLALPSLLAFVLAWRRLDRMAVAE